jgi:hypothetical protein
MFGDLTTDEIEKLLHQELGEIKGITFAIKLTSKTGRFERAHQPAQSFF